MKELIAYLRENLILDFQGDLSLEIAREFLNKDGSREAKAVMAKLVADGNANDMLLVLADILLETVKGALTDEILQRNLQMYADS